MKSRWHILLRLRLVNRFSNKPKVHRAIWLEVEFEGIAPIQHGRRFSIHLPAHEQYVHIWDYALVRFQLFPIVLDTLDNDVARRYKTYFVYHFSEIQWEAKQMELIC